MDDGIPNLALSSDFQEALEARFTENKVTEKNRNLGSHRTEEAPSPCFTVERLETKNHESGAKTG